MRRLATALAASAAIVLVAAPGASATETRAEYAAQANATCTTANAQTERKLNKLLKGAKDEDLLALFAKFTGVAIKAEGRLNAALAAIAAAPGDEALVGSWLQLRQTTKKRGEKMLAPLKQLVRALKHPPKNRHSIKRLGRLTKRLSRATRAVAKAMERADVVAIELGATACATEGAPPVSASVVAASAGLLP